MISELERYQGVVLRQLVVACGRPLSLAVANLSGRIDAFSIDDAAFIIKHSSKRLSPWQFTYLPENLDEIAELQTKYNPVWAIFVCGQDGVVGLSYQELVSLVELGQAGTAWVRVSRSRNSMYRISGARGDLSHAKSRGLQPFLEAVSDSKNRSQNV